MHRKKAKKALWLAETYGLPPKSLVLSEENGQLHTVNMNNSSEGNHIALFTQLFKLHNLYHTTNFAQFISHNLFVLSSESATGPGNTAEINEEITKGDAENVASKGKRIDKINFHIYMYGIICFNVLQQGNGVLYLSSL